MKVYVASSWRNPLQPSVVRFLREFGHDVYDFRNPSSGNHGFHWREVEVGYKYWSPRDYIQGLEHPAAQGGFASDMEALQWADCCVLALPCNRSAHLELGWSVGAGKRTVVLLDESFEPELMYKMVDRVCVSLEEVAEFLQAVSS